MGKLNVRESRNRPLRGHSPKKRVRSVRSGPIQSPGKEQLGPKGVSNKAWVLPSHSGRTLGRKGSSLSGESAGLRFGPAFGGKAREETGPPSPAQGHRLADLPVNLTAQTAALCGLSCWGPPRPPSRSPGWQSGYGDDRTLRRREWGLGRAPRFPRPHLSFGNEKTGFERWPPGAQGAQGPEPFPKRGKPKHRGLLHRGPTLWNSAESSMKRPVGWGASSVRGAAVGPRPAAPARSSPARAAC